MNSGRGPTAERPRAARDRRWRSTRSGSPTSSPTAPASSRPAICRRSCGRTIRACATCPTIRCGARALLAALGYGPAQAARLGFRLRAERRPSTARWSCRSKRRWPAVEHRGAPALAAELGHLRRLRRRRHACPPATTSCSIYQWYAGIDPDDSAQFTCANRPPNGYNQSFYCSAAMDAAQAQALANYEIADAQAGLREDRKSLLVADAPIDFLWWFRNIQVLNPDLHGFDPNPVVETWDIWHLVDLIVSRLARRAALSAPRQTKWRARRSRQPHASCALEGGRVAGGRDRADVDQQRRRVDGRERQREHDLLQRSRGRRSAGRSGRRAGRSPSARSAGSRTSRASRTRSSSSGSSAESSRRSRARSCRKNDRQRERRRDVDVDDEQRQDQRRDDQQRVQQRLAEAVAEEVERQVDRLHQVGRDRALRARGRG